MWLRILVVDDQKEFLSLLHLFIQDMCCHITLESDGMAALKALRDQTFNLIITDVVMYPLSGIDLVSHIRQMDKKVPIIAMSGMAKEYWQHQLEHYSNIKFWIKDGDFGMLKSLVQACLYPERV
jgi:CheY-like chemotaxis protein